MRANQPETDVRHLLGLLCAHLFPYFILYVLVFSAHLISCICICNIYCVHVCNCCVCVVVYVYALCVYSVDLYGGDQTISVSIGSEEELKRKQKVSSSLY